MIRRSSAAAILAAALLTGAAFGANGSSSAAPDAVTSGLPLYQFVKTSGGPLPWNATSLGHLLGSVTVGAGPLSTVGPAGQQVVAFTTSTHAPAYLETVGATTTFTDLDSLAQAPAAGAAPTPFFDGTGALNLAYVTTNQHVELLTYDPQPLSGGLSGAGRFLHHDWLIHDLTNGPAGVMAAPASHVSTSVTGDVTLVALRSPSGALVVLSVDDQRPRLALSATTVAPSISSDPVFVGPLSDHVATIAALTSAGHLTIYRHSSDAWLATDVTGGLGAPTLAGQLAATASASTLYVSGLEATSNALDLATGVLSGGVIKWTRTNLTALTSANTVPGPALSGRIAMWLGPTSLQIAGAASGWGDLFDYTGTSANAKWTWAVTDVSATGGSSAKTVAAEVAAAPGTAGATTFLAGGVSTPAPRGVGVYAIPQGDYPRAISDGWRILADTGGLGTQSAPWVNVAWSPLTYAPDFQTGLAIQNSHQRETWLSFWTISGPVGHEVVAPATFSNHGFSAGAAIATEIDAYRANGLGLKPDWVILDPEGYPDLHSGVDSLSVASIVGNGRVATITTTAPSAIGVGMKINVADTGWGSLNIIGAPVVSVVSGTTFTIASGFSGHASTGRVVAPALVHADWAALLRGWSAGMASVDPSLKAAVYADESEYLSGGLAGLSIPVFLAIAWVPPSSPQPITHSSNVLGYIEWGNECASHDLQRQLSMLVSAPWNGLYNTVQFNPGTYCKPTAP